MIAARTPTLVRRRVSRRYTHLTNAARPQRPKRLNHRDRRLLKAVVKTKVAQPNLVIRSVGKIKNVMIVARKATHHPIATPRITPRKRKRQRKMMITNQELVASQELAQLAALRSCAKT